MGGARYTWLKPAQHPAWASKTRQPKRRLEMGHKQQAGVTSPLHPFQTKHTPGPALLHTPVAAPRTSTELQLDVGEQLRPQLRNHPRVRRVACTQTVTDVSR